MNTSITKSRLKELVKEVMVEEADYQTFFKKALEKAGKGINDMTDDEKKEFFNKVDTAWNGKGEKNEELTGGQHKLDVDKDGDIEGDDLADLRANKTNENIATELPKVTIPSAVKQRLGMAIDKIKDAKLSNVQKLQLVAQVIDSLGIDKSQLGTMASKIRSKMESVNEEAKPILKPGTKVKLRGGKSGKIVRFDGKTPGSPFYIVDIGQYYSIEVPAHELETESVTEADGLWANIRAKQARGEKPAHGNSDAHKDAVAAGEKINKEESVSEGVSSADMDKIKGAVEAAKSFMNVGAELKKLGMKYTFATEPLAIYIIQPTPNNKVAIVNKKYVSKPDFVVGDIAVGVMEGKSVNEEFKHIISVETPTQVVSKPIAAQILALAKKGVRSKDIGLKMGFVGNAKLASDTFQKVKNKIYFDLDK